MTARSHRHAAPRPRAEASARQPALLRMDAWIALVAMACYIFILTW